MSSLLEKITILKKENEDLILDNHELVKSCRSAIEEIKQLKVQLESLNNNDTKPVTKTYELDLKQSNKAHNIKEVVWVWRFKLGFFILPDFYKKLLKSIKITTIREQDERLQTLSKDNNNMH